MAEALPVSKWLWDFGDGSSPSTSQSPSHIYTSPGVYTVVLTVTLQDGTSYTQTRERYIHVSEWASNGLNVSKTDACLMYGETEASGLGASFVDGSAWIRPAARVNPITILDRNDQVRTLVPDIRSMRFFELTGTAGVASLGHRPVWKDRVKVDGTGGVTYDGETHLRGVTGTVERHFLEYVSANVYTRPVHESVRNEGYDIQGYPADLRAIVTVRDQDEITTEVAQSIDIKLPSHEVMFDSRLEGHALKTELKFDRAPLQLVGVTQNLLTKDRLASPVRGEDAVIEQRAQEFLSSCIWWVTRGVAPTYDRITQTELLPVDSVATTNGLDGLTDSALLVITGQHISIPTEVNVLLYWFKGSINKLPAFTREISSSDGWKYVFSVGANLVLGDNIIVQDLRGFAMELPNPISPDWLPAPMEILEYAVHDMVVGKGRATLPRWE